MHTIRPLNDLHNEFKEYEVPVMADEKNMVLTLSGDIYDRKYLMRWVHSLSPRFKAILIVLGNHDYWGGSVEQVIKKHKQYIIEHDLKNVYVLDCESVMIDNILYYGGTMWTNFNNMDPMAMMAYNSSRDCKFIRHKNYRLRWSAKDAIVEHNKFKLGLQATAAAYPTIPMVVMSHHGPTHLSIDPNFEAGTSGAYVADMSNLIMDHPNIRLWHHGHTHSFWDYVFGPYDQRTICNPLGYNACKHLKVARLVKEFDPNFLISSSTLELT